MAVDSIPIMSGQVQEDLAKGVIRAIPISLVGSKEEVNATSVTDVVNGDSINDVDVPSSVSTLREGSVIKAQTRRFQQQAAALINSWSCTEPIQMGIRRQARPRLRTGTWTTLITSKECHLIPMEYGRPSLIVCPVPEAIQAPSVSSALREPRSEPRMKDSSLGNKDPFLGCKIRASDKRSVPREQRSVPRMQRSVSRMQRSVLRIPDPSLECPPGPAQDRDTNIRSPDLHIRPLFPAASGNHQDLSLGSQHPLHGCQDPSPGSQHPILGNPPSHQDPPLRSSVHPRMFSSQSPPIHLQHSSLIKCKSEKGCGSLEH